MATFKFIANTGMAIRSQFRSVIKDYCFTNGYKVDIEEDAGFLSTDFRIVIYCPDSKVYKVKEDMHDLEEIYGS